ncbi:MAG: hypothetical protein IJ386_02635 [Clostridia bacterium]|nr:hypothetical protein [Clostridia bacterium]
MKEIFPSLIKNDRLKQTLSGSLSHAYIIEGVRGSGRLTAVRCAAAAALCENRDSESHPLPCGECSVCSRIFRGIHPDVIETRLEDKKSIGVDTVRTLRSQVFIAPSESDYKFFVIGDADLMTPEAQNALLISLEEPPEFSVFFLLVTDKSLLLETIRSRCVTLNTEKLDADTVRRELEKISDDITQIEKAVSAADGSLGEAIRLISEGSAEKDGLREVAAELIRVILTGSAADKVRLAVSFPKSKDSQDKIFTYAVCAVRDIISKKLRTSAEPMFYGSTDAAAEYSVVATAKLMTLYNALEDARLALSGNASASLTAEKVIMIKLQ